ncbi:MAG: transcriptional regulator [Mesorhizobium amorphae]|nr:MAG: transcriptional regulator [Mesorhizobium amorphae]
MASSERPRHGQRPRPSAMDKQIGAEVRNSRLLAKVSQEQLGARIGISFQQIQKYERGTNKISASRLQQIAAALELPITHFFDVSAAGPQANGQAGAEPPRPLSALDARVLDAFHQIEDPVVRKTLLELLMALSGRSAD